MTFEELVLHNFGVYKGRHTIDLRPEPGKPIILIGALNGGGKTTLLDALQLVLYGKHALCSNRGTLAYDTFLRRSINRCVDASDGAAVELQLCHTTEEGDETVRIHRSWRSTGKSIRETAEVKRNGQLDPVYTEHWYEHVDEFIPSRMSSLFFFDGEKIEHFAEPENASDLLRTGMQALLGLDLVDQLERDLDSVIQKRLSKGDKPNPAAEKLDGLGQEETRLTRRRQELTERRGELHTNLTKLENRVRRLANRYRSEGGAIYDQRERIAANLLHAQEELGRAEHMLRDLAAGDAPLLLLRDSVGECEQQASLEHEAEKQETLLEKLHERDAELMSRLAATGVTSEQLSAAKEYLSQDRSKREQEAKVERYLNADPIVFHNLSNGYFDALAIDVTRSIEQHASVLERISADERKLQAMPHPDKFEALTHELANAQSEARAQKLRLEDIESELSHVRKKLSEIAHSRQRLTREQNLTAFADETTQRVVTHANLAKDTFRRYQLALTCRHLNHLESLILENLQQLLRKQRLIHSVHITPGTYALGLVDASGEHLSPERLSAGERQLLAVSIVWALTKASGRPLPAVIDTPLGRLDGNHRRHLIDVYFPNASHQVLLLSTDEEIDHRYYQRLLPATAKEYHIQYREEAQTSVIESGYPWVEVA